jgi:hypothetical protein
MSTDIRPHSWMRVPLGAAEGCGNVLETYRQRGCAMVPSVNTGVTPTDTLGGAHDVKLESDGVGRAIKTGRRQVAVCECGAQLVGDTREALFEAAERHVAHHHPELMGALELDVVMQMAEDVGGIDAGRRPGA